MLSNPKGLRGQPREKSTEVLPALLSCADLDESQPVGVSTQGFYSLSDADAGALRDYSPAEVFSDIQMYGWNRCTICLVQVLSVSSILFGCIRSPCDALYVVEIASKLHISKYPHPAINISVYCDAMPLCMSLPVCTQGLCCYRCHSCERLFVTSTQLLQACPFLSDYLHLLLSA